MRHAAASNWLTYCSSASPAMRCSMRLAARAPSTISTLPPPDWRPTAADAFPSMSSTRPRWSTAAWAAIALAIVASAGGVARAGVGGQLEIKVVDYETGEPLACRMHLTNQAGKVQKPPQVPFWHDHFAVDGSLTLKLPSGNFNFVVERSGVSDRQRAFRDSRFRPRFEDRHAPDALSTCPGRVGGRAIEVHPPRKRSNC